MSSPAGVGDTRARVRSRMSVATAHEVVVGHAVADEVQGRGQQEDGEAREEGDPPLAGDDPGLSRRRSSIPIRPSPGWMPSPRNPSAPTVADHP